ncbi:MAG: Type 1 glutamine amidotransferase-like domain-containing protein [Microgenomates group bacterium]|jgi:peptidase E
MKIVYRGGYNKHSEESTKNSLIFEYADIVKELLSKGKKVVYVTLAKPDGFYDEYFYPLLPKTIQVVDSKNLDNVNWSDFDVIFLLGGLTIQLDECLRRSKFSLESLKEDVVLVGDSAGAYVLSKYYFEDHDDVNVILEFRKGFCPQSRVITVAHVNNPHYVTPKILEEVHVFAKEKGIRVLELIENESKLLDSEGNFVDFDINQLFEKII